MGVLSCVDAAPGGKPFETFGKDSETSSEGGNTGRRTDWPCHINIAKKVRLLRPSVPLPAGIHGCAGYKDFACDSKVFGGLFRPGVLAGAPATFTKARDLALPL